MYPVHFLLVIVALVALALTIAAAVTPRVPLWVAVLVLCLAGLLTRVV